MRDCIIRYRSNHRRCSIKKVFLEISQNSQEKKVKDCARVSFSIKLLAWGPDVFLGILRNFKEHLFYRTPRRDYFCRQSGDFMKQNVFCYRFIESFVYPWSIELKMVWKSIIFTFCLIKSWSYLWPKWVHKHFRQLAEGSLRST